MPTTVISEPSLFFVQNQGPAYQRNEFQQYVFSNMPSPGSSNASSISSSPYNEGSISPIRSPDTTTGNLDSSDSQGRPYLKILEEPQDKFRFRYKTEMQGTHGTILGASTNSLAHGKQKSFPTVKLCNYSGSKDSKNIIIRCTLYTANDDNKMRVAHVHRMVSKDKDENDDPVDIAVYQPFYTAVFKNMTILFTKKEEQKKIFCEKKMLHRQKMFTSRQFVSPNSSLLLDQFEKSAAEDIRRIDVNVACLRFDALIDNGHGVYEPLCQPVYSNKINNLKNAQTNDLKICRIDRCSGTCKGGDEVFMFVEKVVKTNIKVIFYEEGPNGEIVWADEGRFLPDDVHHQYAIAFRTPPYRDIDITSTIEVKFKLMRPKDNAFSTSLLFTYRPDPDRLRDLRRKRPRTKEVMVNTSALPTVLNDFSPKGLHEAPSVINSGDINLPKDIDYGDDLLNEILNCSTDKDPMLSSMDADGPRISSSDWSSDSLLKYLSPEHLDAVSQMASNGTLLEYGNLNGVSEGVQMLLNPQAVPIPNDVMMFDGNCTVPTIYNPATAQRASSDTNQNISTIDKLCKQLKTSKLNDRRAKGIQESRENQKPRSKPCFEITMNEYNIIEKTEKTLNLIWKLKLKKRLNKNTYEKSVEKLFNYKVKDTEDSVFHVLAASTSPEHLIRITKFLKGLRILNETHIINCVNHREETPLLVAARKSNAETVTLLLDAGADVNATDIDLNTAAHIAALRHAGSMDIMAALMDKEPQLSLHNVDGFTVLHLAVLKRKSDIISALLVKAEDNRFNENLINVKDLKRGNTALHIAVENRFIEIVSLLLNFEDKINVNIENHDGKTALAFVMEDTDKEAKELCLLLKENIEIDDENIIVVDSDENVSVTSYKDDNNPDESSIKRSKKDELDLIQPELEIVDVNVDESESAYAREWEVSYVLFNKTTISKLCPILDDNDQWRTLLQRLKYRDSEIDLCKIHWSPSLSAFRITELHHPEITADKVRDVLFRMGLKGCAQIIDDMLLQKLMDLD